MSAGSRGEDTHYPAGVVSDIYCKKILLIVPRSEHIPGFSVVLA
ncbi:hypothetical protein HOE425_80015 [Hoeflea sp. EC-HK425]|nr:hypothetical protein HOE425_80015 [Hoeflea sp. EC-HK425]